MLYGASGGELFGKEANFNLSGRFDFTPGWEAPDWAADPDFSPGVGRSKHAIDDLLSREETHWMCLERNARIRAACGANAGQ